jgi:hypothetical protein
MCVYIHSSFIENHPIQILKDGPLISEGVLSQFHLFRLVYEGHCTQPLVQTMKRKQEFLLHLKIRQEREKKMAVT